MIKFPALKCLLGVLFCVQLIGCGSDQDDLRRYMHEVKSRPAKTIEPIPTFEQPPKFVYPEDQQRRSPFKPLVPQQQVDTLAPNTNRPKQPLEAYPLDALKFVGILKQGGTIWGLISQPTGGVVRVRPGDYMGKNYGQIIQITEKNIKLEEIVQVNGKWEKKPIVLKLHSPE